MKIDVKKDNVNVVNQMVQRQETSQEADLSTQNGADEVTKARCRNAKGDTFSLSTTTAGKLYHGFTLYGAKCMTVGAQSCDEEHCFSTLDSSWVGRSSGWYEAIIVASDGSL